MKIGQQVRVLKTGSIGTVSDFSQAGDLMINVRFDGFSIFFYPTELSKIENKPCRADGCNQNGVTFFKMMSGRNVRACYRYCEEHANGLVQCPSLAKEITAEQFQAYLNAWEKRHMYHAVTD